MAGDFSPNDPVPARPAVFSVNGAAHGTLKKLGIDAPVGRFDNCVVEDTAEDLVKALLGRSV